MDRTQRGTPNRSYSGKCKKCGEVYRYGPTVTMQKGLCGTCIVYYLRDRKQLSGGFLHHPDCIARVWKPVTRKDNWMKYSGNPDFSK